MKVFLSWSGEQSKTVATIFNSWLPSVLQNVRPWLSTDQLEKGASWLHQITEAIQASNGFGLFFLTEQSISSAWLLFEAGGIAALEQKRVCTVLVGIENDQVPSPLKAFQSTKLEREDVFLLLRTINQKLDVPLTDSALEKTFEMWWPDLEVQLAVARNEHLPTSPAEPPRDAVALLERLSGGIEGIEARLARLEEDFQRVNHTYLAGTAKVLAEIGRLESAAGNAGRGLRLASGTLGLGLSDASRVTPLSDLMAAGNLLHPAAATGLRGTYNSLSPSGSLVGSPIGSPIDNPGSADLP